jgi:hypothetical protein
MYPVILAPLQAQLQYHLPERQLLQAELAFVYCQRAQIALLRKSSGTIPVGRIANPTYVLTNMVGNFSAG